MSRQDYGIEVVCLSGLESRLCTRRLDANLDETGTVVEFLRGLWEEDNLVLLVSASLRGSSRLLSELESLGYNPYLVEFTGVPEVMLSGLVLDDVISFHLGHLSLTAEERRRAKKIYPAVTRRELFRSMFLVAPRYTILPVLDDSMVADCSSICPYGALGEGGLNEKKCRGCMLCFSRCPQLLAKTPAWTGPASMAYVYSFASRKGLDGVVFLCRRALGLLDEKSVEASPARLLAVHVPCISWLSPRLLSVLRRLGLYVHVLYEQGLCSECRLGEAASRAVEELTEAGIPVSESLVEASAYAYTGLGRSRRSEGEVAEEFMKALGA